MSYQRSLCVHGHFYQPPRQDPITELIPSEPGAHPFKNWNERIHSECYRPNAELGNFEHISFNIGPTLFEWMDDYDLAVCRLIGAQDRANVQRYGVGNAIAQAYNHTILPLASLEDKITQVHWGIADFIHRFGRKPQGMWLPETAVDLQTLSILADAGIEFTILAPWQASEDNLDTTEPYRLSLPEGRKITIFFYQQGISADISFNPYATSNADTFVTGELLPSYNREKQQRGEPQLLLVASDGELYGHHQKFRDRFLAHLVNGASTSQNITPTFPAVWLKNHPPRRAISIREKTSWSCHHGVLRWSGECGCSSEDGVWKAYMRLALDHLAFQLDHIYLETLAPYVLDPWALRNRYIQVMLGQCKVEELIFEMSGHRLDDDVVRTIALLLEAQRQRQRMFTSCGWFFEDFNRIEPRNNVAYAAQVVRLVRLATGDDLGKVTYADLKHVISHRTGLRGDTVFQRQLRRANEGK